MKLIKRILICGAVLVSMTNILLTGEVKAVSKSSGVGLSAHCIMAYNENWQYSYGGTTPGSVDCSGLIWSYNGVGGNRCDMLEVSNEWGYVCDGIPRIHGLGLHQPGHVGVYIGSNQAIDARDYGVNCVLHNVGDKDWVEWFKVVGVEYPDEGWVLLNGKAYYYEDGQYIVDTQRTFDNITYTFDILGVSNILPPDGAYIETDYYNIEIISKDSGNEFLSENETCSDNLTSNGVESYIVATGIQQMEEVEQRLVIEDSGEIEHKEEVRGKGEIKQRSEIEHKEEAEDKEDVEQRSEIEHEEDVEQRLVIENNGEFEHKEEVEQRSAEEYKIAELIEQGEVENKEDELKGHKEDKVGVEEECEVVELWEQEDIKDKVLWEKTKVEAEKKAVEEDEKEGSENRVVAENKGIEKEHKEYLEGLEDRVKNEINERKKNVNRIKSRERFKREIIEISNATGLYLDAGKFSNLNVLIVKSSTLNNDIKVNILESDKKEIKIVFNHLSVNSSDEVKTEYMDIMYSDVFDFNNDVMAYSARKGE